MITHYEPEMTEFFYASLTNPHRCGKCRKIFNPPLANAGIYRNITDFNRVRCIPSFLAIGK